MTLREKLMSLDASFLRGRNDVAIAEAVSVGQKKIVPTEIGNGMILATIGLEVGNALLDTLNTAPDFRYVKPLLEQGRLDIGTPLARAALDSLVGIVAGFEQTHADALKSLAEQDDPVSVDDTSAILNAEGY